MQRVIFHCDCNNYYASVELLQYPHLADKPVAVSGSQDGKSGIILAKNEKAKEYNVKTAEAVWQARRKCPDLVLLPPHRKQYTIYCDKINRLYESFSDRVEPFGIDESWLDMSHTWQLFGESPKEVADKLRRRITEETGLTISVGVSFNKIFAKLASDFNKPNATTVITEENYQDIIWPLAVNKLLFVGNKASETLRQNGVHTVGDLATADPLLLKNILGNQGAEFQAHAQGIDNEPVRKASEKEPVKSVGNGKTFKRNVQGVKDARVAIGVLADSVATRLRSQNIYATNLQLMIKSPDFESISRQSDLPYATNLAKDLTNHAMKLLTENWNMEHPIRMLTVTAQNLTDQPFAEQTSFLEEKSGINRKRERLEGAIDNVRDKFGDNVILEGGSLHNDLGFTTLARPDKDKKSEP